MKNLKQFGLILFILWIGNLLQGIFDLALPGNVIGMMILLVLLSSKILKLKSVENISSVLLDHLSFLFIPTAVGIITVLYLLEGNIAKLLFIVFISFFVVMIVTGLTIESLIRLKNKKGRDLN